MDVIRPALNVATMVHQVESALAVGACGASSGLEYTPGGFAPLDELIALSAPLRRYKLPYTRARDPPGRRSTGGG